MIPRRHRLVAACTAMLAAACSAGDGIAGRGSGPGGASASGGTASGGPASGAACPPTFAAPDPNRPTIVLQFDLAADLHTVQGTEQVEFTPDLPVRELVFRLTANTAPSARAGNGVRVRAATADPTGGAFRVEAAGAGAGTQGGLLVVPLGREVPAGQKVTARLAFTLTLGEQSFDRFGRSGSFAWWGSGQPLLGWEHGVGWHREPMLAITGESATSEAARTDLTVTAPAALTVLASGTPAAPVADGAGRRRWRSTADRARDVSVAAGPFRVRETTVSGVRLLVGTPAEVEPATLLGEHARAIRELAARFGPFPFPTLSVARLPAGGGGIEYPGSILMLDDSRVVAVHETAHQYFYAMVGDSQARDPWLDEAFATYAEQLVNGDPTPRSALDLPQRVGSSVGEFGQDQVGYFRVVYGKGSAALEAARTAAGAPTFDAALRCYVNSSAWRIARPADLARALSALPAAVAVLRKAGALP